MPSPVRRRLPWLPAALLLAAAMAFVPAAIASTSPVYPVKAKVAGVKAKDLIARWTQWHFTIPATVHPVFDTTGDYAGVAQQGGVFFLPPTVAGEQTARDIRVPAGVAIFFPVVFSEYDNAGQLPSAYLTTDELYQTIAGDFVPVTAVPPGPFDLSEYYYSVDGVTMTDLAKHRLASSVFSYTVCPDTVPTGFFPAPAVKDTIFPAVTDGYWVALKPFLAGSVHTVVFGRNNVDTNVARSNTFNITVGTPQE